jgi:hypothetical protein
MVMKNKILTIIVLLTFIQSYSQTREWGIFSNQNLRCYENNTSVNDQKLSGIDFRTSYTNTTGDVVYHMDSFSKIKEIPSQRIYPYFKKHYLTGNSILGHRVKVSPTYTTLYFVNDSVKSLVQDSLTLLNSPAINQSWICYEDSLISIVGKNTELKEGQTPLGLDSLRTLELIVTQKSTSNSLTYTFEVGKSYGLLRCVDFGEFIHFSHDTYYTKIFSLMPYVELTEKEFFTIEPNTEIHIGGGTPQFKNGWIIQWYQKANYYMKNGVLVKDVINLETRDSNYMDPNPDNVTSIKIRDTSISKVVIQKDTSDEFFNPLPNSINTIAPYGYAVSFTCNNGSYAVYRANNSGGSSVVRLSEDSLALTYSEGDASFYSTNWISGIGKTFSHVRYQPGGRSETSLNLKYIKTDSCEIGEKIRELNSVLPLETQQVKVYPNPASNVISIGGFSLSAKEIQVYNLMGTQLQVRVLDSNKVDISKLSSGVYFLQFHKGDTVYRGKFVKE